MPGNATSIAAGPEQGDAVDGIESALHALARCLKQSRLHDYLLAQARVDADQAGLAVLYVLQSEGRGLRVTDLADQLRIDAPAVTRKAQQLERSGLVSRSRDSADARVTRLQLTAAGRRTIGRFLAARRRWLASLLAGWPELEQAEFARLLRQFTSDIQRQMGELDD